MSRTNSSQGFLSSLPLLDALRSDPDRIWQRIEGSNLDVLIQERDGDPMNIQAICHLNAILPLTAGDGQPRQKVFEEAAAIAMAAHHLNVGDGSIVPEVGGLPDRCGIRFTVEFADTEYDAGKALNHVVEVMGREAGVEKQPCAFIGAYRSAVSIPTSILTGLRGFPQISGASTSADLDDNSQFPLFGRTIPSDQGNAVPIIKFMSQVLGIEHLAVININDAYGNAFVEGMRMAAKRYAPNMKIQQSPVDDDVESIKSALESVKATQYRFIFAIVFTEKTHDTLMEEAYRLGIAGTGQHQWLFGDSFGGLQNRKFAVNSPLHLAYRGVAIVEATGGIPGLKGFDKFVEALATLNNPIDVDNFFKILPSQIDASILDDNFVNFLDPPTSAQSTFLYEAAIALGLSACNSLGESIDPSQIFLDGREHYRTAIDSTFQGVNDLVVFDSKTGSKDPTYTLYTVENFVDLPESDDGIIEFKASFSHIYEGGSWQELEPFIFNDGTSTIPVDIPPLSAVDSTITLVVRVTVLSMCAIILAMAGVCMWWTNRHRKTRVVLASQPFFLHIICIGVFVLGCTIIPLSIDSGVFDIDGCSKACTAVPWLGLLGFSITISALFTKTHRVNIILNSSVQMKRITVTIWDVAKPMLALISVSVIILSCMTTFAPPFYELVVKTIDVFGRSVDIRGQCNYNEAVPYLAVVSAMNAGGLTLAIVQAFKARNLSTEFAESKSIFRALLAMILVVFVGGPVLLLARDNTNVYVFVASAIIFVSCMSILILMFAPKLTHLKTQKKIDKQREFGSRVLVSGLDESIRTEEHLGMKILTTKTPEELLREVEELKFLLLEAAKSSKTSTLDKSSHSYENLAKRVSRFLPNLSGSRHSRTSSFGSAEGSSSDNFPTEPTKEDDAVESGNVARVSLGDGTGELPGTIDLADRYPDSMDEEEEEVPLNDEFVENKSACSSEAESVESLDRLESFREKRDSAMLKLKYLRSAISENSSPLSPN